MWSGAIGHGAQKGRGGRWFTEEIDQRSYITENRKNSRVGLSGIGSRIRESWVIPTIDPQNPEVPLLYERLVPIFDFPEYKQLTRAKQLE
jgi:hypothetical protein